MTDAGRSSMRVNGRQASAGFVREFADAVAEVVGQHEAQHLLSPAYHLELLDRFAGGDALKLRAAVGDAYARAQAATESLEALMSNERDARERYDEACFIVKEIGEAKVDPAELERLAERRAFLDNVERIAGALHTAREALTQQEACAMHALGLAAAALSNVGKFSEDLHEMAARASALQSEAGELGADVARALDATEFDPAELEAINSRLASLERLARRYGGSLDEVVERARRARQTIDEFENRDELVERLRTQAESATRELEQLAESLSKLRKKRRSL